MVAMAELTDAERAAFLADMPKHLAAIGDRDVAEVHFSGKVVTLICGELVDRERVGWGAHAMRSVRGAQYTRNVLFYFRDGQGGIRGNWADQMGPPDSVI